MKELQQLWRESRKNKGKEGYTTCVGMRGGGLMLKLEKSHVS